MIAGVPRETFPGERRVAIVPSVIPALLKNGIEVIIETGAGEKAGYSDNLYIEKKARITKSRKDLFNASDILVQVRSLGANPEAGHDDLQLLKKGKIMIGLMEPLAMGNKVTSYAEKEITAFALEFVPRITRAQSMDVLSSQATVSGYKAALIAANSIPRMFPMLMTAAGTITAARVFVIGAGVAGLQAISTCHRLGAVVQAYDVRPAVKEQVQSVGAKFLELPISLSDAEGTGGYAKLMSGEFYKLQAETMSKTVAASDAVIATAAVPGKKAPVLITADMVRAMPSGSVIVDLAAERGGNCELTKPDEIVVESGVSVIGLVNAPSSVPYHASQMYAKNISAFLLHIIKEGKPAIDRSDEIIRETMILSEGFIVNERVKEALSIAT